jgi:protein-S-isoprenylcysteine O-methyltransferase Ste14
VGVFLIVFTYFWIRSTFNAFRKRRSSSESREAVKSLITDGPYRFGRNPMYLSAAILQLGLAIFLKNIWMGILILPTMAVITLLTILPEERFLEERFGETYRNYKAQVRRWI